MKLIITIIWLCLLSCANRSQSTTPKAKPNTGEELDTLNIAYDFQRPSKTHVLDRKLVEISSLAYNHSSNSFMTNDDEHGRYYELSYEDFSIVQETKFAGKGDYESIEVIGNQVWIGTSNGHFYAHNSESGKTNKIETSLKAQNDLEGLCLLKDKHTLLLACKGQPLNSKGVNQHTKCIYQYDVSKMELILEPYLAITDEDLIEYIENYYKYESKVKLKKLTQKIIKFAPSGIAINPLNQDIFITSAKGSTLVIYDKMKRLKSLVFLSSRTIPQPEGITFDSEGNLFISTEGQGLSGKVFRFEYNQ